MTARVFVDTNVLVYARDTTEAEKHRTARHWMAMLWAERGGALSWQVLHEYYVCVTRKLTPGRDAAAAREDVASLVAWRPIPLDLATVDAAWAVEDRFGLSWWDALIVAAAQAGGCTHLLTEDLQDGQVFAGVRVISPFVHTPEEILTV
ncbi:MAG: PIN domain-containing protein [Gemmatimonadales bacterium]